ncbi:MAG: TetR/AcrR family transcriptional regulator [Flavobacteriales bacterium]|jgi:AcrR family transcriptional regulator|tara:strand:- start:1417 stop:2016 length:600 start_codon:yes stop_codon:yes gene_type:complete
MRQKIINTSTDLFLNLGFKSVTMDDIAAELGMSKKTIYIYFENKEKLVEATEKYFFKKITDGIKDIKNNATDPISELYDVKLYLMKVLKGEKTSPFYQLKKYYPLIYKDLKKRKFDFIVESSTKSLEKGVKQGLFRENINIELISRLYFNGMVGIKDPEIFDIGIFNPEILMENYLEYHLRAIVTEKGLEKLKKFISIS